jgi:hypothetical protein
MCQSVSVPSAIKSPECFPLLSAMDEHSVTKYIICTECLFILSVCVSDTPRHIFYRVWTLGKDGCYCYVGASVYFLC